CAADLGEDPDEIDGESVAARQRSRDIGVVIGIGIGGVRVEDDQDQPTDEGKHVQGDGDPHGRCSLAPGPNRFEWYGWASPTVALAARRPLPRRYDGPVDEPVASRVPPAPSSRSRPWFDTPNIRRVLLVAAVVGTALGIETVVLHLSIDPLVDGHAYYDAGARLNAGLPLYEQAAGTNDPSFYRYPPLLAIAFRPLALLPYMTASVIWEAIILVAFGLTVVRLGPRKPVTWVVLGMLALPIGWSLAIGQ